MREIKNTAVIAEYNPFHNGHKFHLEKTRELTGCENIIAVMSGNFTQRGEPAVYEKHIRERHALENGADMVLELPVEYAAGAADVFAGAAVYIIEKSGIADALCFGSEQGSMEELELAAEVFAAESDEFKAYLAAYLSQGISYPSAREKAASKVLKRDIPFAALPNNILAVEYLAALKRLNSRILPFTVKREQNGYNDLELSGGISSAAAIRQSMAKGSIPVEAVPKNTLESYKTVFLPKIDQYSDIFAYVLRTASKTELSEIADMTEGLENRFLRCSDKADISGIIEAAKTKRYTYTKLQRAVLHTVLGITKTMQNKAPAYIRVLGVGKDKKYLINELAAKSSLPVVTRVKENEELLKTEIKAGDIYHLLTDRATGSEYKNGMVMV